MFAQSTPTSVFIRIACSVDGTLIVLLVALAAVRPEMMRQAMLMVHQMIPLW